MTAAVQPIYKQIGRNIREARQKMRTTHERLGLAVGLNRSSTANIELGRQRIMIDQLQAIAGALGCDWHLMAQIQQRQAA